MGGPHHKDCGALGSIFESLCSGKIQNGDYTREFKGSTRALALQHQYVSFGIVLKGAFSDEPMAFITVVFWVLSKRATVRHPFRAAAMVHRRDCRRSTLPETNMETLKKGSIKTTVLLKGGYMSYSLNS